MNPSVDTWARSASLALVSTVVYTLFTLMLKYHANDQHWFLQYVEIGTQATMCSDIIMLETRINIPWCSKEQYNWMAH